MDTIFKLMIEYLEGNFLGVEFKQTEGFNYISLDGFGLGLSYNPDTQNFVLFKDNPERRVVGYFKTLVSVGEHLSVIRSRTVV